DFVRRQIHHFSDDSVGFVQARWGHLNQDHSVLTELQSLYLNGHFVLEHTARQRSGRFFSFSGTAGTWRKACIADAGGWQHCTLVEDLDLSYRAQLNGWRGVYLVDQEVPAELPVDMNGFKSQQHRWAKGFIQAMLKLLGRVWKSDQPLRVKIECTFHLTNNLTYLFMVTLAVLMLPALIYRVRLLDGIWGLIFDISIFLGASVSVLTFYAFAQRQIDRAWWKKIHYLPLLMGMGMGIALNQARAVIEALRGIESPFVRTPKYNVDKGQRSDDAWRQKKYRVSKNALPILEIFFAVYFLVATVYAASQGLWISVPFLALFLWGFAYVGFKSLPARPRRREVPAPTPGVAKP
ncbi:MAG: glycosyltransferase, partial [Salinibacterium sp.]|nr:glycosyltransferase [Salinibacterium sp.]